jgi:hypothetical protein
MNSDEIIETGRMASRLKNDPFFIGIKNSVDSQMVNKILNEDDKDRREDWVKMRKGVKYFLTEIDNCINIGKIEEIKQEKLKKGTT